MTSQYVIRKMVETELQIALSWARKEGWNPGVQDEYCFYQADPQGFFLGLLDGEPISVGSAVVYDDHFAFFGLYIVSPEFRNRGYGIQLTHKALNYMGNRITGLDGVLDKVSKYERLGYRSAHRNIRYELNLENSFACSPHTVDLKTIPFNQLEEFDRRYFPAPRSKFLRCWINQPHSYALGYIDDQNLKGYGVIRKCYQGYKIGPLFATSPTIAKDLFDSLCSKVTEGPVYLDVPEPNENAMLIAKQYKMSSKFEVIRMYRNGTPQLDLQGIYGISTFELG